jgi:hypothetical protein
VSYDSSRGGISVITFKLKNQKISFFLNLSKVITEKSDITTSYLLIQRAKSKDSGIYTCEPSNAKFSNITVHILNGNYLIMF